MYIMGTRFTSDRSNPGPSRQNSEERAGARHASSRFGDVAPEQPPLRRAAASRPRTSFSGRRPPRRRKPQKRFYVLIAAIVILLLAIAIGAFLLMKPGRESGDPLAAPTAVASVAPTDPAATPDAGQTTTASANHAESLAALLGDADSDLSGLGEDLMAKVDDLCINENLPEEWLNVLLLGSDERTLTESARTDSMIICSINLTTGQVKLSSIMRDLAVEYDEIGEYNGTYRINAANFFGGEELAMRIVNKCFDLNIEYYVHVNFYVFQQVAQQLGGIDMDITKEEMDEINYRIVQQAKSAYLAGIDESALPNEYLTTYGENTHLDGRQTLAYARIRKLDGGDYARAERQRKVLVALMDKLRGSSAAELLNVANAALPHIKTNLTPDTILSIALKVLQSGLTDVDSLRLPINNTYVQETRSGQDMLYDCDWAKNASELYYFIYN